MGVFVLCMVFDVEEVVGVWYCCELCVCYVCVELLYVGWCCVFVVFVVQEQQFVVDVCEFVEIVFGLQ